MNKREKTSEKAPSEKAPSFSEMISAAETSSKRDLLSTRIVTELYALKKAKFSPELCRVSTVTSEGEPVRRISWYSQNGHIVSYQTGIRRLIRQTFVFYSEKTNEIWVSRRFNWRIRVEGGEFSVVTLDDAPGDLFAGVEV